MASANIFSQFVQPVRSLQDYTSEMDKADENALRLAALRNSERKAQRDEQESNAFRRILNSGVDLSTPDGRMKAIAVSPNGASALFKSLGEAEKLRAEAAQQQAHANERMQNTKNLATEQESKAFDLKKKAFEHHAADLEYVRTPADIVSFIDRGVNKGLWDNDQAAMMKNQANALSSVDEFVTKAKNAALAIDLKFKEAEAMRRTAATNEANVAMNRLSNETSRANNDANNSRIAQEGAANRSVTMRGQNLTDARAREVNNLQKEASRNQVLETPDGFALVDKATGTVRPLSNADGSPVGGKLKDAPAAVQKAMLENSANLRKAQSALALIEGNNVGVMTGDKNAVGLKGFAPDFALNRVDPKGVDTRAAIADLGSMILHERSGAAVTAAEFPRLQPFIPKVNDSPEVARKKLARFVQEYGNEVNALQENYGQSAGYRQPGGATKQPAKQADIDALVKKYGGK